MLPFFLSFISPLGRCPRWAFWWWQLLLAVLLYPCTRIACYGGLLMFGSDSPAMKPASFLPPALAQSSPFTCYTVALLAAWSSLALTLKRLRDTRAGLRALPLCLILCWGLPMPLYEQHADFGIIFPDWLQIAAIGIPLIASVILTLLPSRRDS